MCHDISGASEHMRVLSELADEALALTEDGPLEKAVSDWVLGGGKLLVSGGWRAALHLELSDERKAQSASEFSWRESETG